jgi:Icc-related predicted phosphoesterase
VRVHVVSDVHHNLDALKRAADGADALIVLGDLIEALDYNDPSRGIMGELYGADRTARWIELRNAGRFTDARAYGRESLQLAARSRGVGAPEMVRDALRRQYAEIFAAMPTPAFCTYGNVDAPDLWPEFVRPGIEVVDGSTVELAGTRIGFVGGGVSERRIDYPYLITEAEYADKLAALGPVDILCTHLPPRLPELCYDTVARRLEMGSAAALDYLRVHRPRLHLFGHVHQPLSHRARFDGTECVNVGHFRESGTPFVLDLPGRSGGPFSMTSARSG